MLPISAIASAMRVGRERHRLGVEIAAGQDLALVGEHQRVVGHAVRFALEHRGRRLGAGRGRRPSPGAGSAAVGVLDAIAVQVRPRGSRCRRADRARTWPRPRPGRAGCARGGCGDRTGCRCRRAASVPTAHRRPGPRRTAVRACAQAGDRQGGRDLGAVEQRQAFLGAERQRCQADRASASAAGITRPAIADLADADQRQRQMRERRQITRGADRALCRHHRQQASSASRRRRPSIVSGRTPERPRPRLAALSTRTKRTRSSPSGAPTPHMCDSTVVAAARRCPRAMRTRASLPKPVLTP